MINGIQIRQMSEPFEFPPDQFVSSLVSTLTSTRNGPMSYYESTSASEFTYCIKKSLFPAYLI